MWAVQYFLPFECWLLKVLYILQVVWFHSHLQQEISIIPLLTADFYEEILFLCFFKVILQLMLVLSVIKCFFEEQDQHGRTVMDQDTKCRLAGSFFSFESCIDDPLSQLKNTQGRRSKVQNEANVTTSVSLHDKINYWGWFLKGLVGNNISTTETGLTYLLAAKMWHTLTEILASQHNYQNAKIRCSALH